MLDDFGLQHLGIWNTETAVLCNSFIETCDASFNSYEDDRYALAQGVLANAALGVKVFEYYTWEGAGASNHPAGLVDNT